MIPSRSRLLGLIVLPVLLVATVVTTVIAVGASAPTVEHPATDLQLPPVVEVDPEGCRRDHDGTSDRTAPPVTESRRVTSEVIVGCPARFDGLRVTYIGEAVGDLLVREGGAWVLVNDDDYALTIGPLPSHRDHRGTNGGVGVWLPDPLPGQLTGLGRPSVWGDVIEVTGLIMRTDPDDGGGLTLRADELTILQPSRPIDEPLDRSQLALAGASVVAAGLALAVRRRAASKRPQPRSQRS
jgi:hypothetical protein